ncbi:MAG: pyridoxamine 5'-phosphate oxidase family protein [Lentisphaerae bacterium]|nr:pyridoxamine 5'-phosphate oxidase family protein [Lentisphaerota bacterium]
MLATQGLGHPYTSLVAFVALPDLRQILFPTRAGTRKFDNLKANPHVSLLIDNRSNSIADYRDAIAITVIGSASVATSHPAPDSRARLLDRHPSLEVFLSDVDCRFATVDVSEYRLVTRFEEVTILKPTTGPA